MQAKLGEICSGADCDCDCKCECCDHGVLLTSGQILSMVLDFSPTDLAQALNDNQLVSATLTTEGIERSCQSH